MSIEIEEINAMVLLIKSDIGNKLEDSEIIASIKEYIEMEKCEGNKITFSNILHNVSLELKKEVLKNNLPEELNKLSSQLKRISSSLEFSIKNEKKLNFTGEFQEISNKLFEIDSLINSSNNPASNFYSNEIVPF